MQPSSTNQDLFSPEFLWRGEDLRGFMLSMLKGGLTKKARDEVGDAASRFVRNAAARRGLSMEISLDAAAQGNVAKLQSDGFAVIGNVFSDAEIAAIIKYLESKPVRYFNNGSDGTGGESYAMIENLPTSTRFGYYRTEDLCRSPEVYRAVNDPRLIHTIAAYLDTPPTVSTVNTWWSFPSELTPGGMQMFHHDRGDFRSCNLFVYLRDVAATGGPHAFVAKTHSFKTLAKWSKTRFANDPQNAEIFWQWMEKHRKDDKEIAMIFPPEQVQTFIGPRGMSFLEDTRGLHKATVPHNEPRLAFEIVYSTLPKYNESNAPISRDELVKAGTITPAMAQVDPLVRYATRLMYA